jgi:hypothetical protein
VEHEHVCELHSRATDSKRTSLLSDQDNVLPVLKEEEGELAELRAAVAG